MENYPLAEGWVESELPRLRRDTKRLLEALRADADVKGGEATAAIGSETVYAVAEVLAQIQFLPEELVRITRGGLETASRGADAVEGFAKAIRTHGDHAHWPGDALVFASRISDSRVVLTTDSDGSVMQVLTWGPEGEAALERVLERLWVRIRQSQEG